MQILFVCTGNTCRSPMCEGYFNHLCKEANKENITAISAGVFAEDGVPASATSVQVMKKYDINIAGHKSHMLTHEDIQDADLIIVMSSSHERHVHSLEKNVSEKTRLLMEFSNNGNKNCDVPDPFGGGFSIYNNCFNEMKSALDNLFTAINDLENKGFE